MANPLQNMLQISEQRSQTHFEEQKVAPAFRAGVSYTKLLSKWGLRNKGISEVERK
jgi:hypothetical protein